EMIRKMQGVNTRAPTASPIHQLRQLNRKPGGLSVQRSAATAPIADEIGADTKVTTTAIAATSDKRVKVIVLGATSFRSRYAPMTASLRFASAKPVEAGSV